MQKNEVGIQRQDAVLCYPDLNHWYDRIFIGEKATTSIWIKMPVTPKKQVLLNNVQKLTLMYSLFSLIKAFFLIKKPEFVIIKKFCLWEFPENCKLPKTASIQLSIEYESWLNEASPFTWDAWRGENPKDMREVDRVLKDHQKWWSRSRSRSLDKLVI